MTRRINLHVFERWLWAHGLEQYLAARGIDAKLVCRYAVQVHPRDVEAAQMLARAYDPETGRERVITEIATEA